MKRALTAFFMFWAMGSVADATATITCTADNDLTLYIQVGSVAVPAIVGIDIELADSLLSTVPDRGEQIALLQSFVEDDKILIDLSDTNLERIVAQIRLFIALNDNEQVTAGTLWLEDIGVFALNCSGP